MNRPPPLRGWRIVVTRGLEKADRLSSQLEKAGFTVTRVPLIAAERTIELDDLRAAVARLRQLGDTAAALWLVLSSEIAVRMTIEAVGAGGLGGVAVAVVGPATAAALRAAGVEPAVVAPGSLSESLAAELVGRGMQGAAVLVVTAARSRGLVAAALTAAGARVEVVEAYRSVLPPGAAESLRAALAGGVDAIAFTSASTVRHCTRALGALPPGVVALCIGPATADAARRAGWEVVVTAAEHTAAGLAAAAVAIAPVAQPLT